MLSKLQVIFSEVPNHTTRTTWRQQLPSRRIQRRAHRNFYPLESSIPSTTLPSCCHALTGTFSLLPTWTETTRQERSMTPSQPHFHLQTRTTDLWLWYTTNDRRFSPVSTNPYTGGTGSRLTMKTIRAWTTNDWNRYCGSQKSELCILRPPPRKQYA